MSNLVSNHLSFKGGFEYSFSVSIHLDKA